MATRTQPGASMAVQYEDFQPNYEWKEEEAANILLLHLPDFRKEKLKITYVHTSRVIKVHGERPITDTKWSTFDNEFSVPQNCEVQRIQGKFQNGVLTITLPKITNTQPQVPSKYTSSSTIKEGNDKKETPQKPQEFKTEQKAQNGIEETSKAQKVEAQAVSPPQAVKDTVREKDEKGDHQKSIGNNKEIREGDGKRGLFEQEEISKKRKESSVAEADESNKKRKEAAAIKSADKEKEDKFSGTCKQQGKEDFFAEKMKNVAASAKNKMKGLAMELTEERQSLVNAGVAVLVIAALGAYIYYSQGSSSGNSKD